MGDGIDFADVRQELVAQAFTAGGTGDQAGDVDELDRGRDFCGLMMPASSFRRGSGTGTMPTFGSMVQNGKFAAAMPAWSAH